MKIQPIKRHGFSGVIIAGSNISVEPFRGQYILKIGEFHLLYNLL